MSETTGRSETVLRRALREKGTSVNWLASQLGINRTYASEIVNGWATETTLRRWAPRIAEVLGEPVDALFPELAQEPDWDNSEKGG